MFNDNNSLYIIIVFTIFIIFFGPRLLQRLPNSVIKLFLNPYFKIVAIFFAIYLINYNFVFALIVTLLFVILFKTIDNNNYLESFTYLNPRYELFTDQEINIDTEDSSEYGDNVNKINQCSRLVKKTYPCNNIQNGVCLDNINADVLVKDGDSTKNLNVFMNSNIDNTHRFKNLQGINNIHAWCKKYLKNNTTDISCANKSISNNCVKINKYCDIEKWNKDEKYCKKPPKKPKTFSGTCAKVDNNIQDLACFSKTPDNHAFCRKLNFMDCHRNKDKCFYIKNNEFVNADMTKHKKKYTCKIPNEHEDLPPNCFPVKLYKDSCGNLGMGCWVKGEDESISDEESSPPISELQDLPDLYLQEYSSSSDDINKDCSTSTNYRAGATAGFIRNIQ